jgi:hypothetical protein
MEEIMQVNNLFRLLLILSLDKKVQVLLYNVKVKESRNRPPVGQRVPGGLGSQIS